MEWHLHPDVLGILLLIAGLYLYGLNRLQPSPRWLNPIEGRQVALFFSGLFVVYLAEGTPLHELSEHYLFSAHMVQHLLITMIAPPLFMLGTPAWLLRPSLAGPGVLPVLRILTSPIVAIAAFNGVLAFWHVPVLYEATLQDHNIHVLNHFTYVIAAFLMWWPVMGPLPELPRLNYPGQMLYLFVQSLVPAILASIITFSELVIYQTYALAPRVYDITPLADQQMGGLIMKIVGGVILWSLAIGIFFIWFNQEEREVEKSWD